MIRAVGISHAAIVENKRPGEILAWIKQQQDRQPRFNQVPDGPRRSSQKPGILKNRALQIAEAAKSKFGIDDWAWRKGCQYGTVICDLERRRIVAFLPDRASGTSAAWLRGYPEIEFIARDRGTSYGDAASTEAPQATQIADRWHLFENASASFLDVVRQNMHAIRKSSATDSIDPALLSCAERKRWKNFQHRKKTVDSVLQLVERGTPLKQITRRLSPQLERSPIGATAPTLALRLPFLTASDMEQPYDDLTRNWSALDCDGAGNACDDIE
jgi:hypothetical protein